MQSYVLQLKNWVFVLHIYSTCWNIFIQCLQSILSFNPPYLRTDSSGSHTSHLKHTLLIAVSTEPLKIKTLYPECLSFRSSLYSLTCPTTKNHVGPVLTIKATTCPCLPFCHQKHYKNK